MTQIALPFAMLCGLVLGGLAASLFALFWTQRAVRAAAQRVETRHAENEAAIEAIRSDLETFARQLREIRQDPPKTAAFSTSAGPGLNLSRRSQALRMHRRGDAPEQIASTLGVPLQEVELLLKIHRIVIAAL